MINFRNHCYVKIGNELQNKFIRCRYYNANYKSQMQYLLTFNFLYKLLNNQIDNRDLLTALYVKVLRLNARHNTVFTALVSDEMQSSIVKVWSYFN